MSLAVQKFKFSEIQDIGNKLKTKKLKKAFNGKNIIKKIEREIYEH